MGQNRMQKNQKDIIYHEMIRRLTRRSAVISHILGIETSSTSGETINPELVSFLEDMNDGLSFDFKNLINAINELDNLINEPPIGLISISYDDLLTKVTNSELEPGARYIINEFETVHHILDGSGSRTGDINTGEREPLIVKAVSINELDKEAISTVYPQDIIYYNITSDIRDIAFYNDDESPVAGYKGQIYFRHDTLQNVSTWYDFRNVKFRRWLVGATAWVPTTFAYVHVNISGEYRITADVAGETGNSITITGDGVLDITALIGAWNIANPTNTATVNFGGTEIPELNQVITLANGVAASYTAKDVVEYNDILYKCKVTHSGVSTAPDMDSTNWIKWLDKTVNWSWTSDKAQFYPDNVTTDNLTMSNPVDLLTFGGYYEHVKDTSIGRNDLSLMIGAYGVSTILNNIVFNTIDYIYTCSSNTFSEECVNNTIRDSFNSNTIGNNFQLNTIGNNFQLNTIGNNFHVNIIGNRFISNNIGDSFNYNTIGNGFDSNTIGDSFNYNTIGDNFYSNTIGDNFYSNTIGNAFRLNTIKSDIGDIDFTLATHVYGVYNCEIYKDAVDGTKLSYMSGGMMQIVDITD